MSTTAWRLLLQDWKLSPDDARVLTTLLTDTPVALRNQEALVPLSKLLPAGRPSLSAQDHIRAISVAQPQQAALFKLLSASWPIQFADGRIAALPVLSMFTLVSDSEFLRYQLNPAFVAVLHEIKEKFQLDALA